MKNNQRGFTLIELLVVMAVFIIVIMITGNAFKVILTQTTKIFRSEESNFEGVVGLEMMRHDLQQGGYGLFTQTSPVAYSEAANAPATSYNETSTTAVPRAFVSGNNITAVSETSSGSTFNTLAGTDYLAIKGMSVGRSKTVQKWSQLQYVAGTGGVPNKWASNAENLTSGERVILMQRKVTATQNDLTVVPDGGTFYFAYSDVGFEKYSTNSQSYIMYGLDESGTPRMPFNRTDYFVARPATATSIPAVCAPNVGVLYKTIVNQADGKLTYIPILDCVADMQVVLGWDLYNGSSPGTDGLVDTYSNADGTVKSGSATPAEVLAAHADSAQIRNNLKVIKIYILAQNGRKDPTYTSPSTILVGDTGEASLTKSYDIAAAGWQNYRWKLYRIVVRPKNLTSNQ